LPYLLIFKGIKYAKKDLPVKKGHPGGEESPEKGPGLN